MTSPIQTDPDEPMTMRVRGDHIKFCVVGDDKFDIDRKAWDVVLDYFGPQTTPEEVEMHVSCEAIQEGGRVLAWQATVGAHDWKEIDTSDMF